MSLQIPTCAVRLVQFHSVYVGDPYVFNSLQLSWILTKAEANHLVQNGDITKGCFVQLNNYQANKVKDRK
jgi:hypothetical protein